MDWNAWHDAYGRPESGLAARLQTVQQQIREALDAAAAGPIRMTSICAGQGRDLIGALDGHSRRADVRGVLVDLDPDNVEAGQRAAESAGLSNLEFRAGDAAITDHYDGVTPADLVLVCGTFGNLSGVSLERLISFLPQLCQTGGTVVWTQNRRPPDRVPQICAWLGKYGFEKLWLSSSADYYGVGRHRLAGDTRPLISGERMFEFLEGDALASVHRHQR